MNRRAFLATTAAGAAVAAFPAILKAQGGDTIKVGFPGPTTGPFGALAKDQQQGASVAMEEINAKGGILGRRLEILFRDDQLKPAVGAQRTRSEEHTSELQSQSNLVCRLLLEKKKKKRISIEQIGIY